MSRNAELSLTICNLNLDEQILSSNIDLHYYGYNLKISLCIKHSNICNYPFETEDDSNFRLSLTLKAVSKFAGQICQNIPMQQFSL